MLGLTENREQHRFPVDDLGLDDETVELLKSGKLNVRLICEMIKHPEFINFLSDMEIYVDNLAGMQFRNINKMIEQTRVRIQNKGISDEDHYMKTLQAATISEDNYFNNLLGNDIVRIAKDIRDAHNKDAETGEATTPVDDILDSFEELKTADNATQAQMVMYSKLLKINFTKMDPYEFKTFTDILQRYSDLCKPVKGSGRGKKKITQSPRLLLCKRAASLHLPLFLFFFLLRIRFMHSDRLNTHDFHVLMLNYRLSGILKRYMPISFSKISLASSKCAAIYSGVWASEPRVIYLPPKSLYSLRISLDGCVSDKP